MRGLSAQIACTRLVRRVDENFGSVDCGHRGFAIRKGVDQYADQNAVILYHKGFDQQHLRLSAAGNLHGLQAMTTQASKEFRAQYPPMVSMHHFWPSALGWLLGGLAEHALVSKRLHVHQVSGQNSRSDYVRLVNSGHTGSGSCSSAVFPLLVSPKTLHDRPQSHEHEPW